MTQTYGLEPRSFFNADDLSLLIMEHPDAPQFLAVKIADAHDAAMAQAAARLSELEADNARLREALKPFARSRDCDWDEDAPDETEVWNSQGPGWGTERTGLTVGDFSKARTALGDKP